MLHKIADFIETHTHHLIASSFGTTISLLLPLEGWLIKAISAISIASLCWATTNALTWLKNKFGNNK